MRVFGALLCFASVLVAHASIAMIESASFEAPFDEHDRFGEKVVGDPPSEWRESGAAVVNKNFIRLTPDRQSKKGALWSTKTVGFEEFSTVFKFRISGQGKNFFGDGIGLWYTDQAYFPDGPIHGGSEQFTGIGIIFDTFKNTENLRKHRDITVLINDGSKTHEMMVEDIQGCAAKVRFHADRDDFSVMDASRAKITVRGNRELDIRIDADNRGEWVHCVTLEDLPLRSDWAVNSYVGISATTGALADNHDVISLKTYPTPEALEMHDEVAQKAKKYPTNNNVPTAARLLSLEETMNAVLNQLNNLDHHIEHEFAAVEDHIKVMGKKIASREDKSDARLEGLEGFISGEVDGKLTERLRIIEEKLHGTVDYKLGNVEDTVGRRMERKVDKIAMQNERDGTFGRAQQEAADAGDWKIPFAILLLVFVIAGITAWRFYEKMKRSHIL